MEAIVVGLDGSPASLDALGWADAIAARAEAKLVVVRAGLPGRTTMAAGLYANLEDRVRQDVAAWCEQRHLAVTPTVILVEQDPRSGLVAVATEQGADLLVVGSRGTSRLAGMFVGGVAQHLAQHPMLPLAVVPAGVAPTTRHVVVGVDGSDGSLAAVRFCADLASALDVAVTAVRAQEPSAEWVAGDDPDGRPRHAGDQAREWVEPIADAGVAVDVVVDGDLPPVAALTRSLQAHPGAIAVVGTRGSGGFAGLRLGRVPLQLLQHAGVPVVIVPLDPR